jgi:HEAT repeat protein
MSQELSVEDRRRVVLQALERGISRSELRVALADDDWRVRRAAVDWLPAGRLPSDAVAFLVSALSERENVAMRNAAVAVLGRVGASVFPSIIAALAEQDEDGRKLSAEVLGAQPDAAAVAAVLVLLGDSDANVRLAAIEALGRSQMAGPQARSAASLALCDLVNSEDNALTDELRFGVATSLVALGCSLPLSVLSRWVRIPLVAPVALVGARYSSEAAAIALLVETVAIPALRSFALSSLAAIANDSVAPLRPGTTNRRSLLSRDVLNAARITFLLSEIACEKAFPPEVRLDAAAVLNAAGIVDAAVVAALLVLAENETVSESVESLLRSAPKDLVPVLLSALPNAPARAISIVANAFQHAMPSDLFLCIMLLFSKLPELERAPLLSALYRAKREASPSALHIPILVALVENDNDEIGRAAMLLLTCEYSAREPWILREPRWVESAKLQAAFDLGAARARADSQSPQSSPVFCLSVSERRALLGHEDFRVREFAIRSIGERSEVAMAGDVEFALSDEVREVAVEAIRVLGTLGSSGSLVAIASSSSEPWLQAAALAALASIDSMLLTRVAARVLEDGDQRGIVNVAKVLSFACEPHKSILHQILLHQESACVVQAVLSLSHDRDARTETLIGGLLGHAQPLIRRLAADALKCRGDRARTLLRTRLEREPELVVRAAIIEALSDWSADTL